MDIIIQSLGFKAGAQLESFIREKLEKLDHIGHGIIRADVTLYMGAHKGEADDACYCEIRLEMPGNDPFAKKCGAGFEQAAMETIDALHEVLRRNRDKEIDQQRGRKNNDNAEAVLDALGMDDEVEDGLED